MILRAGQIWALMLLLAACGGSQEQAPVCGPGEPPSCVDDFVFECVNGVEVYTSCGALGLACVEGRCSGSSMEPEAVAPEPSSDPEPEALEPDPSPASPQPDAPEPDSAPDPTPTPDAEPEVTPGPCPDEMVPVESFCIDRFEAPNREGALPMVMISLLDAESWCQARGKRVCFDDEWGRACEGPEGLSYPYGETRRPGECTDDKIWRVYTPSLLNSWPAAASGADIDGFEAQLALARGTGSAGAASAEHVESLYQATPAGDAVGCRSAEGVYDLVGNTEEWTKRRDGGDGPSFTGALRGRYWAESRDCRSRVTSHADPFRFYETGFRCCMDQR